jgi:hypothetical protein
MKEGEMDETDDIHVWDGTYYVQNYCQKTRREAITWEIDDCWCDDNIKMEIIIIGLEGVDWINFLRIGSSGRLFW